MARCRRIDRITGARNGGRRLISFLHLIGSLLRLTKEAQGRPPEDPQLVYFAIAPSMLRPMLLQDKACLPPMTVI